MGSCSSAAKGGGGGIKFPDGQDTVEIPDGKGGVTIYDKIPDPETLSGYRVSKTHYDADDYAYASRNYTVDYVPYMKGHISKTDAGQLYKAVKNDNVTCKPELIKMFYNTANQAATRMSRMAYNQDPGFYNTVYSLTHSLLNSDYKTAQKTINGIEYSMIKLAGKKSIWHKYRKSYGFEY